MNAITIPAAVRIVDEPGEGRVPLHHPSSPPGFYLEAADPGDPQVVLDSDICFLYAFGLAMARRADGAAFRRTVIQAGEVDPALPALLVLSSTAHELAAVSGCGRPGVVAEVARRYDLASLRAVEAGVTDDELDELDKGVLW